MRSRECDLSYLGNIRQTMKILLTGARGMLGQALQRVLADQDVIPVDVAELDITDPLAVRRAFELYRPEACVNAAAFTNVDACETEESVAEKVNAAAVGYLAKSAETHRIPIVHISTDYVFDGTKSEGYRETDQPTVPVNAYGRTKLHGEQQLQAATKRFYLVRTAWLYGLGGKNFVETMLRLGATKPELSVVNDQHGIPTYTDDLAMFIRRLLIERAPYGVYHGVNTEPTTWYDFAVEIFRQGGLTPIVKPCTTAEYPLPARRPAWSILLNTKQPQLRSWREALAAYLRTRA